MRMGSEIQLLLLYLYILTNTIIQHCGGDGSGGGRGGRGGRGGCGCCGDGS